MGLPTGPSFFSFSDPEQSLRALCADGFASPVVRQAPQVWRLDDADSLVERIGRSSVRAGFALRLQSPTALAAIRAALREKVFEYKRDAHFEVPMPAIVAAAIKP